MRWFNVIHLLDRWLYFQPLHSHLNCAAELSPYNLNWIIGGFGSRFISIPSIPNHALLDVFILNRYD